jgi:hypothetical protein
MTTGTTTTSTSVTNRLLAAGLLLRVALWLSPLRTLFASSLQCSTPLTSAARRKHPYLLRPPLPAPPRRARSLFRRNSHGTGAACGCSGGGLVLAAGRLLPVRGRRPDGLSAARAAVPAHHAAPCLDPALPPAHFFRSCRPRGDGGSFRGGVPRRPSRRVGTAEDGGGGGDGGGGSRQRTAHGHQRPAVQRRGGAARYCDGLLPVQPAGRRARAVVHSARPGTASWTLANFAQLHLVRSIRPDPTPAPRCFDGWAGLAVCAGVRPVRGRSERLVQLRGGAAQPRSGVGRCAVATTTQGLPPTTNLSTGSSCALPIAEGPEGRAAWIWWRGCTVQGADGWRWAASLSPPTCLCTR